MRLRQMLQRFAETAEPSASKIDTAPSDGAAKPAPVIPSKGEVGLTGTVNWNGRIHAEANTKLQWERAFGTPGATQWGEWEKLERTDHQVAAALNLLAAPIRDAEIEVVLPDELMAVLEQKRKQEEAAMAAEQAAKAKPPEKMAPNSDSGEQGTPPGEESKDAPVSAGPPKQFADDFEPSSEADDSEPQDSEQSDEAAPEDGSPSDPEDPDADVLDAEKVAQAEQLEKIAEFVRDNLQEWIEPGWPMLLEQIVRYGLGYGFSLHEIVWDVREDERVDGGTAFYVKKLAQRLPSSVDSDGWVEKNGELVAIRQSGVKDGKWIVRQELPADKCLLATWNRSGNNYQGYSAFRAGWYMGQVRAECLKIMAVGAERQMLGVPVAEVDKEVSLTDKQRDDLQEILENLVYHENAGIQLPPGVKMNWVFADSGASRGAVLELWRALGLSMLEMVQVQQQALGTGDTGSRAVGEVHDGTKNAFVQGIRAWVEMTFNGVGSQAYTGLVRKIVNANFGPQEFYPKLRLVVRRAEMAATEFATAVKTLSDAGALHLTEQDENDIRERVGLSPIDSLERARLEEERKQEQREKLDAIKQGNPGAFGGAPGAPSGPGNGQNMTQKPPKAGGNGSNFTSYDPLTITLD